MFPRLWKGLSFRVHQVTLLSPYSPHHPQPGIRLGWKETSLWITILLPVWGERVHGHVTHFVHVFEKRCICSHFTVVQKRSSKPRGCICGRVRARLAGLSAVLWRAMPVCASVLPPCTFRGALGQGAARLGEMPEELLSALSLRV